MIRYLFAFFIFIATPAHAADEALLVTDSHAKVDQLMDGAISGGLIAGGVVLVGDHAGVLFEKAYGKVSSAPNARAMTVDTVFDIASLTKVIATTPAILKLMEEGKLSLVDPVEKLYPEFYGHMKDDLLMVNLLTHTSCLDDFPLSSENTMQSAVNGAATQKMKGTVWSRFKYADINFILLADSVKRVSGKGLDSYAAESFFRPLGMNDTAFNPNKDDVQRYAATLDTDKTLMFGQAQDYVARQLGGVAGHAGLFSTAGDLGRFCRMMLNRGTYEGRQILSRRVVDQMTAPYFSRGGKVVRGLGWDIDSPYSSPRGNGFSPISYGHTGYSGSSVWIDPAKDLFVVVLTSRLDYKNTRNFNELRSALSSAAVEAFAPALTVTGGLSGLEYQ
ncbi:serine hydrolase domain-containing protein [Geotalea sp. SG265]|uniref:serine hydrolase domain-containing protein n=1 Tax=Geotalea sp. SG265 TaxID=2922867 RepID=UPI001FAF02CD|nr:serine hydrolase domain-containing protein [Geotalea sp. SG265]